MPLDNFDPQDVLILKMTKSENLYRQIRNFERLVRFQKDNQSLKDQLKKA